MSALSPQKIMTFLMFEGTAAEAMNFYISLFEDAEILSVTRDEAAGTVRHAIFSLAGQRFMCIDSSVSHDFGFTPSMSLYVQCRDEAEIDRLYSALVGGGTALMPLGSYGFSAKFGWVNDRFGVSWQLNLEAEPDGPVAGGN
jgi:predicted 3-demethylubiquinone-9 3-methyltransferase (glyoxalase superfamily)